eukprot:363948-Chlamydomonas_euryale.AAC.10
MALEVLLAGGLQASYRRIATGCRLHAAALLHGWLSTTLHVSNGMEGAYNASCEAHGQEARLTGYCRVDLLWGQLCLCGQQQAEMAGMGLLHV